jgi:hypothetical protein
MQSSSAQDIVHANVVVGGAHDATTHYLRSGRGPSVLLLSGDEQVSRALIAELPKRCRLIAPEVPKSLAVTASGFHTWLRGFLDALGINRASIVVGPCFAAQVLGFGLAEPERIERLVFLLGPCGSSSSFNGDPGVIDRLERSGQAILATPIDPTDEPALARALSEISAFLGPTGIVS